MVGRIIGRWTVLKRTTPYGTKGTRFLCRCECGTEKEVWGANLSATDDSASRSCGCGQIESAQRTPGQAGWTYILARYKANAKIRGILFRLNKEEFREICSQSCYYCGAPPADFNIYLKKDGTLMQKRTRAAADRAWIKANGVDRKDSTGYYTYENCVPACAQCNYAKMDYTTEEFFAHAKRIVNHQNLEAFKKTIGE